MTDSRRTTGGSPNPSEPRESVEQYIARATVPADDAEQRIQTLERLLFRWVGNARDMPKDPELATLLKESLAALRRE